MTQRQAKFPTFTQFLKAYRKNCGLLAAVAFIPPVLSMLPIDWAMYAFPPLGDLTTFCRIGILAFALGAVFCSYFLIGTTSIRNIAVLSLAIAFISFVVCAMLALRFTRRVDDPADGTYMLVSVGYQRSAFALSAFPNKSDVEMLHYRGPTEEEIQRLWTIRSLVLARASLLLSYGVAILGWTFSFSCFVAWEQSRDLPSPQ